MYLDLKELAINEPEIFLTELEEYFFNVKTIDADISNYVLSSTFRAFRHKDRTKGAVSESFKNSVSPIIENFEIIIKKYGKKLNRDIYDAWHDKNVQLYKKLLNDKGVFSSTIFNSGKESYNSYAKPFNLLIWTYTFGKLKGKPNYDRQEYYYFSNIFHPAIDSDILRGIKLITSRFKETPFNIPINATMSFLDSKDKYYLLLRYMRDLCDLYNNENTGKKISVLAFESFWRMKNL